MLRSTRSARPAVKLANWVNTPPTRPRLPGDSENEAFEGVEKSDLAFLRITQSNLRARELLGHPRASFPHRAFLLAEFFYQILEGVLIRVNFVAEILEELFERLPFIVSIR